MTTQTETDLTDLTAPAAARLAPKGKAVLTWQPGKDGSLALVLSAEQVEALALDPLVWSATGKSASPVSITVPPLAIGEREYTPAFSLNHVPEKAHDAVTGQLLSAKEMAALVKARADGAKTAAAKPAAVRIAVPVRGDGVRRVAL